MIKLAMPMVGRLPPLKYIQVQTHSRCNADCLFCPYIESEHAAHPGTMQDSVWRLILDNLVPFRETIHQGKFAPYLMQEPLIDKTIFAKIDDIYSYFPRTCVEISTNGAALTDKVVEQLLQRFAGRRHDLWVSHHGVNKETFEFIMKIDYERATANLFNLLRKANGKFHIKIRGAGQSRDGKHTYFTPEQYRAYWMDQFRKNRLNTTNVDLDAFTFHDRAGTLHRADRGACDLKVGKVRDIGPGHPKFGCNRLDQWAHFDYTGDIRLCCHDYHHEVKLPNIQDISLLEYFQSDVYRDLVAQVIGLKESPEDFICKRCQSPGG